MRILWQLPIVRGNVILSSSGHQLRIVRLKHGSVPSSVYPQGKRTTVRDVKENTRSIGCSIGNVDIAQHGIGEASVGGRACSCLLKSKRFFLQTSSQPNSLGALGGLADLAIFLSLRIPTE